MKIKLQIEPDLIACRAHFWINSHSRRLAVFCDKHGTKACSHRIRRGERIGRWWEGEGWNLWSGRGCA